MNTNVIRLVRYAQLLRLYTISLATALLFLTLSTSAIGQTQQANPWPSPPGIVINRTPLIPELKRYVVFIVVTYRDGQNIGTSEGTGFFVAVPDKRLGEDAGFSYFVTNRHMADPSVLIGHPVEVLNFSIVANQILPTEDSGQQRIEIKIPNPRWLFPQDPSVDLAVTPLGLDSKKINYLTFPETMFATKDIVKSLQISEGDTVILTGFFAQFPGRRKIEPIIRQGILAMLPEEEIPTTLHLPGHLYLADLHSFHGNSGSPVFINLSERPGGIQIGTEFPYALLGVMSGYMYETEDLQLQVASTLNGKLGANSGITTIVPVDELKKMLDGPDLSRQRDDVVAIQTTHKQ